MKKKLNRKPAYKKGGESWVSDKMENLPMYQMGAITTSPVPQPFEYLQGDFNLNGQVNTLDNKDKFGNSTGATNKDWEYIQGDANLSGEADYQDKFDQYGNPLNNPYGTEEASEPFMNPYGGVDIESRLSYGANQLGKGNTAQGILGLASGALGAGRIGVGAFAAGNREKFLNNEYNDKVNKSMVPRTMALKQDGGMIDFMQDGGEKIKNPDGSYSMRTTRTTSTPGTMGRTIYGTQGSPAVLATQGVNSTDSGRNRAFAEARNNGEPTFMYNGKSYTTEMSGTPGRPAVAPTPDIQLPGTPPTFNTIVEETPLQGNVYRVNASRGTIGGARRDGIGGSVTTGQQYTSNENLSDRMLEANDRYNAKIEEMYAPDTENLRGLNPAQLELKNAKAAKRLQELRGEASVNVKEVPMGLERNNVKSLLNGTSQFSTAQAVVEYQDGGWKYTNETPYSEWNNYQMDQKYQGGGYFQEGGEQAPQQGETSPEQIITAYAQSVQQDPQAIMQQLQQLSPEEQGQALQEMMATLQQGAPQEFKNGGTLAKKLTGEYTLPLDKNDPTQNAEVEKNEFLQDPQGNITKAEGEAHEAGGTPVNLEGGTRIVSDHLKLGAQNANHYKDNFDLEVKASDTYAKVLSRFTTKSGLQKIVDEQEKVIEQLRKSEEAAQGSSTSESTSSLNKLFLSQKLEELEQEKAPLEEARKALMNDVFSKQEESKPMEEKGEGQEFQNGGLNQNRFDDRLSEMRGRGYTGTSNIGEMQAWMNQNYPQDVVNYFTESGQPLTAKHVDIIKQNHSNAFEKTGISPDKASASYTEEEKLQLQNALGENLTEGFLKAGFNDNKKVWRFPMIGTSLQAEGIQRQKITAPSLPNFYQAPTGQAPQIADIPAQEAEVDASGKPLNLMMLPNQNPMLPDSLEGALKVARRYDRVNPMKLSTDQQIGDLRSQEAQAMAQINQMPESQRAGAMANLAAITQQNIAKVTSDVNRTNISQDNGAQQVNAQIQTQEENARASDLQNYENKIMRAKATTDADVRGYYNNLQANNLVNYNSINQRNYTNQMFEHFKMNENRQTEQYARDYFSPEQAQAAPLPPVTTAKKKAPKKRFGGKTK